MPDESPTNRYRARVRRRLSRRFTRQIDGIQLTDDLRRRAALAEAKVRWLELGGDASGRHEPEARAQVGEDVLLWGLFGDQPGGFYIEAGAFDGYALSVTYLFECAGWSGLLVEPLPDRAAACAARRPHSRVVHAALSGRQPGLPQTAEFTRVTSDELLSYLSLTGDHSSRLRRESEVIEESVIVPVSTLDALLEGHVGTIDFVSLDVEGWELAVLGGFDLDRWRPRALLLEDDSFGADRRVPGLVKRAGYAKLATADFTDLYVRGDDRELIENFAAWWGDRRVPGRRKRVVR